MAASATREVPIALLYQVATLHEHLKQALTEFGARVVYETETAKFDRASLASSGASVVVVNLDPGVDEDLGDLDELLVDDSLNVIFNDGEVSSKLQGWDQARWARHLAAKILGLEDTNPPRPPGSEAVPIKVKQAGPDYIGAPDIGQSFSIEGGELAAALAADTGEAIARTRAALVTELEPITPELMGGRDDVHPESLIEPPGQPITLELPVPDFAAAAQTDDFIESPSGPPTLELPIEDLRAHQAAARTPIEPRVVEDTPEMADAAADLESALRGFGFLGGDDVDAAATEAEADATFDDLSLDRELAAPALEAEPVEGLEALLGGLSLEPMDEAPAAPAAAPVKTAPTKAAPAKAEPAKAAPAKALHAPAQSKPGVPKPAVAAPMAPASVAKKPEPAPVAREAPAAPTAITPPVFDLGGLSLEPIDGDEPAAPTTGRARYKIDEHARAPAHAPPPKAPPSAPLSPAPVVEDMSLDALDFDLPLVDTEAPASDSPMVVGGDLIAEFEAMMASDSATPTAQVGADGPVRRVWVLGASIGGPEAVREFLGALPPDVPALFLLAQHMGADFLDLMIQQLSKSTRLKVRTVVAGDAVAHGEIVVVPLSDRLLLDTSGEVRLAPIEDMSPYSPSIDQVMRDVADRFGPAAGAIVFSGMAHDAIDGSVYLAEKGGTVWAQDPATCVISSMVDGAIDAGVVKFQGAPADLARRFLQEYGAG